MPGKSDFSEGVNGCVHKSGLVNMCTLIFHSTFSKVPLKKKGLLFVVGSLLVTC